MFLCGKARALGIELCATGLRRLELCLAAKTANIGSNDISSSEGRGAFSDPRDDCLEYGDAKGLPAKAHSSDHQAPLVSLDCGRKERVNLAVWGLFLCLN